MIKRPLLGWVGSFVIGILCYKKNMVEVCVIGIVMAMVLFMLSKYADLWMRLTERIVNVISISSSIRMSYKRRIFFTKEDWHRFLWPVFFLLGYLVMLQANQVSPFEADLTKTKYGTICGEIADIRKKEDTYTLLIHNITVNLKESNQWYQEHNAVIYTKQEMNYSIGNQVSIQGNISPLTKSTNPGQFDEYAYYKTKGVICKVYADESRITNDKTQFISNHVYQMRCQFVKQIQTMLPEEEAGLMSAILFGDKTLLSDEVKKLYQENGFAHIMAVSGLHISLLGYGLYRLLRKLTAPLWIATLVPVLILVFYGALVGFSVSSSRAIFMFALMMLATYIGRWYDMISALSLAGIILLLKQPLQLFDAGFLLSFASVIGIAVIYPALCEAFIVKGQPREKMKKSLLLSASTQLMTLPLTCYFFYEISLYSLWINLILLPLCSFLVFTSLLAVIFSFFFLPLGKFIIGGTYYLLQFFSMILHIPEKLPYHLILIGKLPILQIIGYYLILLASYLFYRLERKRISWFGLAFLILFLQVKLPTSMLITCLDVSQGDGIIITSQDKVVMIDGGSSNVKLVYEYRIKPFLKSKGIRHIDTIFLTHADEDHVNGIIECFEQMESNSVAMKDYSGEITVGKLVISKLDYYDEEYQKVICLAQKKGVIVETMQAGEECVIGGVTYEVLHPNQGYPVDNRNNTSLVLWAQCREFDGLFLGDVDQTVEEKIVQRYYPRFVSEGFEFLKAAHHGSKFSTSVKMLEAVKPEVTVISVGKENLYGHPHEETILRLKESGSEIWMTSEYGAMEWDIP